MKEWRPFKGMQTNVLQSTAYETLAGGARGPGKTDAGVIWLAKPYLLENPRARALVIRKNSDDLADWLDRARYYYKRYGGIVSGQPALVRFPSGYTIRTGHLKDADAYTKYQGQEYQRMVIEELTQIPDLNRYLKLIASCRSTVEGLDARILATTNPGGRGHAWVKERFIDPAPWGVKFVASDTSRTRVFFPGLVEDNPELMTKDPDYIKFLDGLKATDIDLWRAWRLGDWNTFAGQFFKQFKRETHVINPFMPSKRGVFVGGMDWGRVDNFSFHLSEITRINYDGGHFFRSKVFVEVYGTETTVPDWHTRIKKTLSFYNIKLSDISWVRGDGQMWGKNIDPRALTIYTQFSKEDRMWSTLLKEANKDRVGGWENLQRWFSKAPDGMPYLQFTSDCVNAIRLFPNLVHDEKNKQDVDDAGENDACDSIRYMHMALKWLPGNVGPAIHPRPNTSYTKRAPQFIGTKQVGLNIDLFAGDDTTNMGAVGGIIRK